MIVIPEQNSHFYLPDGSPVHGKLREARKYPNSLPSVTTCLKTLNKPSLTAWLQQQAILSSLTLPRTEGESDDDFSKRVVRDMGEASRKATDFGTRVHSAKECIHRHDPAIDPIIEPYVQEYRAVFMEKITKVIYSEKVLVNNKVGYAGTVDLVAEHKEWGMIVQDTKTQGIKNGNPVFYPDWAIQLAAYAKCLDYPAKLVSCIINSTEPDIPHFKVWGNCEQAWEGFKGCLALWKYMNKWYR
jgi:hypothetical protein